MQVSADTIVTAVSGISFSRLQDEFLSVDPAAGFCYSMNEVGARIWEMIARPTPVAALCDSLCKEYSVERETCMRDLVWFLSAMREARFIGVGDEISH